MKALITGASSGMGRDMAKLLAIEYNYDELVIVARGEDELNKVKEEIESKSNCKVKAVSMDLTNKDDCIRLYSENKDVDLLINNAGFGDCGYFTETDLEKEISMINTNITAYHILTKLYLQDMVKRDKGHILNVASIAGFMPGPLMATYYATKNYVVRLSEAIRYELKKQKSNVKISILCPGPVKTNFDKVANVKFSLEGMESMDVAKYALSHLNKFYIVPGLGVKFARANVRYLPSTIASKFAFNSQKKKIMK